MLSEVFSSRQAFFYYAFSCFTVRLTYLTSLPPPEHGTSPAAFHRTRFCVVRFAWSHDGFPKFSCSCCIDPPPKTSSVCLDSARDVCGRFPQSMTDPSLFQPPHSDLNPLFAATNFLGHHTPTMQRCNDAYNDEGLELGDIFFVSFQVSDLW